MIIPKIFHGRTVPIHLSNTSVESLCTRALSTLRSSAAPRGLPCSAPVGGGSILTVNLLKPFAWLYLLLPLPTDTAAHSQRPFALVSRAGPWIREAGRFRMWVLVPAGRVRSCRALPQCARGEAPHYSLRLTSAYPWGSVRNSGLNLQMPCGSLLWTPTTLVNDYNLPLAADARAVQLRDVVRRGLLDELAPSAEGVPIRAARI